MSVSKKESTIGIIFGCISAISYGTYGLFQTYLLNFGFSAELLTTLAPTVLMIYFFIKCCISGRESFKIDKKMLILLFFNGALVVSLMNYSFVRAYQFLPIGIVSLFNFCNVLFVMVVSKFLFGFKFNKVIIISTLAAIFGVALVMGVFGGSVNLSLEGIFWGILVLLTVGTNYSITKYYFTKGLEVNQIMFYQFLFGSLATWMITPPWVIVSEVVNKTVQSGPSVLLILVLFIILPCICCYEFLGRASAKTEIVYVTLTLACDPATSTILGFVFLNQGFSILQLVGIIICIGAISVIGYMDSKQGENEEILEKAASD